MQPIYVFHNMNTMQQRLGIPYYSTSSVKKRENEEGGDDAAGNNILRNYYLVHGQQPKNGEEAVGSGNNISPIPLQTPRELYEVHHSLNNQPPTAVPSTNLPVASSSSSTGHNISSGNINIAAAREKLLLKYNLFAHNIALAGENHLSLLQEVSKVEI